MDLHAEPAPVIDEGRFSPQAAALRPEEKKVGEASLRLSAS